MSLINSISDLMLGLGDLNAESARQAIANQELLRQNKHRILKGTLRTLATIGPMFIPGAPLAGLLGSKWAGLAASPFEKALTASLTGANAIKGGNVGPQGAQSPGQSPGDDPLKGLSLDEYLKRFFYPQVPDMSQSDEDVVV